MGAPGYLYIVKQTSVQIWDNSVPSAPTLDSTLISGEFLGGFKDGNFLYILQPGNMSIYSLIDPSAPALESSITLAGVSASTGAVHEQFTYLVGPDDNDVHIVRTWPPDDPEYIGSFYGYDGSRSVVVHDGTLYLFTEDYGLRVFDLL